MANLSKGTVRTIVTDIENVVEVVFQSPPEVLAHPLAIDQYHTEAGVNVQVKTADVNATADGDNTVIAAVASKRIMILGYVLMATAAGAVLLKDGAGTTKGRLQPAANGGASWQGGAPCPAFLGSTNTAFIINNAAGLDTVGHVTYIEIT